MNFFYSWTLCQLLQLCLRCHVVREQIQSCCENSALSIAYVIHGQETVVFLVLSAIAPALRAPGRKSVLFWPSRCGCCNSAANPKKQYHHNALSCWCQMISWSLWSHILRLFVFFVLPQFPVPFLSRARDIQAALPDIARHLWIRLEWSGGPCCHYRGTILMFFFANICFKH